MPPTSEPASTTTAVTAPDGAPNLDLDAYLARTGWTGERRATAEALRSLHRAHLHSIPFENLDALLGSAPSLALPDLEAKLVRGGRGGYCFEHNTLFAAVLRSFGFHVTPLTARVLRAGGPASVRPRTHMLLLVRVPGEEHRHLADVGFGGATGLLEAVPLVADTEFRAGPRRHRLVRREHDGPLDLWVLQSPEDGAWADQYAFTLDPVVHADIEVVNWYMATHPRSPFSRVLAAHRATPEGHLALRGRTLVETAPDGAHKERELADADEVLRVLADDFKITAPEGARAAVASAEDRS
ncbi:arylamine N-acetyltransferase [Streptomyces sp. NPDC050617]|uniref:arylamine N-acetyltransferase family protein n=1 Tax=Streptomyces sp. NPDC050617 TaxID=3154628 RepID=UPI003415DA2D